MIRPLSLVAALLAFPALASGPGEPHEGTIYPANGAMTYEIFQTAVPHVDLEGCPAEFDEDVVFRPVTLANEPANVVVFLIDGDQLLLAVTPCPLDGNFLPFRRRRAGRCISRPRYAV